MPAVILVFVDGVGLGHAQPNHNPLTHPDLNILGNFLPAGWSAPPGGGRPQTLPAVYRAGPLPFSGSVVATDASLGIEGLPQSATGQTTLLTGVNGGRALGGRHYTGFPTATLKTVLRQHSVLKQIRDAGRRGVFLNAFGPRFFSMGEAVWEQPFLSATTWATKAAGLQFRSFDDLAADRAVFHDITHDTMKGNSRLEPDMVLPPREPEQAGRILAAASAEHDFVLFEFFQTDKAGHKQDRAKAERELIKLERFLTGALSALDLSRTVLLMTSDHGNVENLNVRTHTHNPVPTLIFGSDHHALAPRLTRLETFTPTILETLGIVSR